MLVDIDIVVPHKVLYWEMNSDFIMKIMIDFHDAK